MERHFGPCLKNALLSLFLVAGGASCTRSPEGDSTLSFKLPETLQSIHSLENASLSSTEWGLNDPGALAQINCYAVLVSRSQEDSINTCYDPDSTALFKVSQVNGLYPAGSEVTITLTSGPSQTIYLLGLVSAVGCLSALDEDLDLSGYSPPQVISKKTLTINPGNNLVTMTASLAGAQKVQYCEGPGVEFGERSGASPTPAVAITSPASGSYINSTNVSSFAITGSCSENGESVVISGAMSGSVACSSGVWSTTLDMSSLTDGSHTLYADHSNSSGASAPQVSRSFIKDTSVPAVTIASPTAGTSIDDTNYNSFTVSGTCTEEGQMVNISGDATASATCTSLSWSAAVDFSSAPSGTVSINVNQMDAAGNTSTNVSRSFNKLAPATLSFQESSPYNFGNVQIGTQQLIPFTVENTGDLSATSVAADPLTSPFGFYGGTFPGVGGNCTATLASGTSCTIYVAYDPTVTGVHADSLSLGFHDGYNVQTIALALNGTGVQNQTTIGSMAASNITASGLTVDFNFSGDANNNATIDFYYCNHTASPGCSAVAGTTHSSLNAPVPGLVSHPLTSLAGVAPGDVVKLAVKAEDADGVLGTNPLLATIELSELFTEIAAGVDHTCGITPSAKVKCWGRNSTGQLGNGTVTDSLTDVSPTGTTWSKIYSGSGFTCAIDSSDAGFCWGMNTYGQLGDGTQANKNSPTAISGSHTWQKIALGANHACGLTTAGAVLCWGGNASGQLGDATSVDKQVPTSIAITGPFMDISVRDNSSCAVKAADNVVWCWGDNLQGQLGNGSTAGSVSTPDTVVNSGTGNLEFTRIEMGGGHTCGITTDSKLYCWGAGGSGQLGITTMPSAQTTPMQESLNATDWRDLSLGDAHTCAVKTDNSLYCWGSNSSGQVGNNNTGVNMADPVLIAAGTSFDQISLGVTHSCATEYSTQKLYCWGNGANGKLGTRDLINRSMPNSASP